MTTSTDKAPKTAKRKGPIRWEAVLPATVLSALVGAYFTIFFDGHVRRAIEYVATQVHGAEVNIGSLSTSFFRASLEIRNIQITDKNKPTRNLIQVGSIQFKMLWDALLRAKVVVDKAAILDIQALSPRKSPGYVVPPPPPGKGGPSLIEKAQQQVLSQTRKQFNENFLGDIASVLGGVDPKEQLKNIQAELKSDARLKELEKELKEKSAKWEQRIKELPQAKDIKQYETRIKELKFDIKNPGEFAKSVAEADKILKEADAKIKLVDQTSKDVKGEVGTYSQAFKDVEKMIQDDLADLQKRLKIPSIDGKDFSQQLFMQMIEQRLVSVRKYVEVARKYMPPKLTAAEREAAKKEQLVPPQRDQGKTYRFPITTGYPLFWLKQAAISSELDQSEYGGKIKGEIKDLTSDPPYLGRPTLILVKGDFPKQNIFDVDATITLDHTTEQAKNLMILKVGRFPVGEQKLSESKDVRLAMTQATGTSVMNATVIDDKIAMEIQNVFGDVKYDLQAKEKMVAEIIDAVLKDIPKIDLNAKIEGSLSSFDIRVNSNLGEALADGFKKQLQAKIEQAKADLRKMIDGRIGAEREKLKAELDRATGGLTKDLDGKKAEIDKAVKEAKASLDKEKNKGGTKKLEEEGKKVLKNLFGR